MSGSEYDFVVHPSLTVRFRLGNPITICEIFSSDSLETVSFGIGVKKHGDKYNRFVGVKKALASATRKLRDDISEEIWKTFMQVFRDCFEEVKK